jgi:hypothetical protein
VKTKKSEKEKGDGAGAEEEEEKERNAKIQFFVAIETRQNNTKNRVNTTLITFTVSFMSICARIDIYLLYSIILSRPIPMRKTNVYV